MSANERQVGGDHYKTGGEEHWDRVHRLGLDYFQAAITKYVERWKRKGGLQDLEKARHFLDKYIELATPVPTAPALVDSMVVGLGEVKPTGWARFTFEGAAANGYLFQCQECRVRFYVPPDDNPKAYHDCGAVATRGYVTQD